MKIKLAQACVMALGLSAATAGAVPWDKFTDAEVAALPPYCIAKLSGVNEEQWKSTLGSTYGNVHHYCYALVYLNRYYKSRDAQDRKFFLGSALSNIEYMFAHAKPGATLIAEIHLTKGRVLLLDRRDAEAAGEFIQAIQLKPDYPDAYAALADFYDRLGKKQDALKVLEDGLRQVPTSRGLARRYQELGGKLPLPGANPPVTEMSQPEAPPSVSVKDERNEGVAPITQPQASKLEQTPPSEVSPGKIGSPSNPWCRFCIDDEHAPAGK